MSDEGISRINAAVFNDESEMISSVVAKTFVVGSPLNNAIQPDTSKISVDNNRCYNAATGGNCNLGDGFDGIIDPMRDTLNFVAAPGASTLTVSYDSPITADTMLIPVNIANAAFANGATDSEGILTADVTFKVELFYKNSAGEKVSAADGVKTFTIPSGTKVNCTGYSENTKWQKWAYLPLVEFEEFTTNEIYIYFDGCTNVTGVHEYALYDCLLHR